MPSIHDARDTYASTIAFLSTRDELPVLLNRRRLLGCGVEVGVKEGEFSATILGEWQGRHLISVDPWRADAPEAYVDIANVSDGEHEQFFATTRRRLAPFGARSSIWRMTSREAAERIPRHSLDFVYIDARHDYASVMEDLEAWIDKVRPGGIIAGHDYIDGTFAAGVFGVRSAVDAFFAARSIPVHPTLLDEPWLTWIAEIPLDAPIMADGAGAGHARVATAVPAAPRQDIAFTLTGNGRSATVRLRLDAGQMSQRFMLECLGAQRLYESETSQFLGTVLQPGDTFIDVGAHVGYFSMLSAALVGPTGAVYAFEPTDANYAQLLEHIALNEFSHVTATRMAVGDGQRVVDFHLNADNDGGHALWSVGAHPFNQRTRLAPETRRVLLTSLDGFLGDRSVRALRAIKIDVEGAEVAVLRGAQALLARHAVPFVVAEVNRFGLDAMGTSEDEMRAFMRGLGYETWVFLPGESTLQRLEPDSRVETDHIFNVLFRRPDATT